MENKAHAFAAGIFVLAVGAMLVAMAAWLTRDTGIHRVFEISSAQAVNGLQPQAAVRYRGVAVGKVMAIGFDPATIGNVLLRIAVNETTPVTSSTFASLGFQGVTGLAFVQLDDDGTSKAMLETSDASPARIPMRANLLSKLSDQGVAILAQIEQTSARVNALLSPDNQKQLMAAVGSFGKAASGIEQMSRRIDTLGAHIDTVLNAQLGPQRVDIPLFVQDATLTFKSLQQTSDGIAQTAAEFRKSAGELTRLAERVNAQGGVVDRLSDGVAAMAAAGQAFNTRTLPRIDRTTDATARTARQVGRAVDAVSDNPQSLIFGNGLVPPGPGEPGFGAPKGRQ